MLASPDSLTGQLDYIREHWAPYLGEDLRRVLLAIDVARRGHRDLDAISSRPARTSTATAHPARGSEGFVGDEFIGFEDEFITGRWQRRRRYGTTTRRR